MVRVPMTKLVRHAKNNLLVSLLLEIIQNVDEKWNSSEGKWQIEKSLIIQYTTEEEIC